MAIEASNSDFERFIIEVIVNRAIWAKVADLQSTEQHLDELKSNIFVAVNITATYLHK
jgi:hypothetical protein